MTPGSNEFYHQIMECVQFMVELDPPADSDEGKLLRYIAEALEKYECEKWPSKSV